MWYFKASTHFKIHITCTGDLRCSTGVISLGTIVVRLEAKVLVGLNYVLGSPDYIAQYVTFVELFLTPDFSDCKHGGQSEVSAPLDDSVPKLFLSVFPASLVTLYMLWLSFSSGPGSISSA